MAVGAEALPQVGRLVLVPSSVSSPGALPVRGRLIYYDMDEYQVGTMIDWLECNDDHGLSLNVLKEELARLESGDDDEEEEEDEEEDEDDAEPER